MRIKVLDPGVWLAGVPLDVGDDTPGTAVLLLC